MAVLSASRARARSHSLVLLLLYLGALWLGAFGHDCRPGEPAEARAAGSGTSLHAAALPAAHPDCCVCAWHRQAQALLPPGAPEGAPRLLHPAALVPTRAAALPRPPSPHPTRGPPVS